MSSAITATVLTPSSSSRGAPVGGGAVTGDVHGVALLAPGRATTRSSASGMAIASSTRRPVMVAVSMAGPSRRGGVRGIGRRRPIRRGSAVPQRIPRSRDGDSAAAARERRRMSQIEVRRPRHRELVAGCALLARSLAFSDGDALPPWLVQTSAAHGGLALAAFAGERVVGFSFALPGHPGELSRAAWRSIPPPAAAASAGSSSSRSVSARSPPAPR